MAIHRKILRWLETELFEGNIQLGQNLPDDQQIARAIGVGRSRTRDALKTLEDMELMRLYSGRGKEIIPYLYDEPAAAAAGPIRLHMSTSRYPTRDMLQTRILLESWAVSNIDPDKVSFDEVDEALETLQDDELSIGEFLDQLLTFHHLLVRLAGNELVVGLLVAIRQSSFDSLLSLMGRLPLWSSTMTRIRVENRAIVDAVKDGDARTARELIAHQLQELYSEAGIELDEEANSPNGMPGDPSESDADSEDEDQTEGQADSSEDPESASGVQEHEKEDSDQESDKSIPESEYKAEQEKSPQAQLPKIIRDGATVSRRREGRVRVPNPVAAGFSEDEADETVSAEAAVDNAASDAFAQQDNDENSHESPIGPVEETAAHEPQLESVQPEFEDDVVAVDKPSESANAQSASEEKNTAEEKTGAEKTTDGTKTEPGAAEPESEADGSVSDSGAHSAAVTQSAAGAQSDSGDEAAGQEDSAESSAEDPDEEESVTEVYVEKAPVGEISAEELVATGLIPWRSVGQQSADAQTDSAEEDVIRAPLRRSVPPVRPAQFSPRKTEKPATERVSLIRRVRHYFGLDLPHTQAVKILEEQEAAAQAAAQVQTDEPKAPEAAASTQDAPASAPEESPKSSVRTEDKAPSDQLSAVQSSEADGSGEHADSSPSHAASSQSPKPAASEGSAKSTESKPSRDADSGENAEPSQSAGSAEQTPAEPKSAEQKSDARQEASSQRADNNAAEGAVAARQAQKNAESKAPDTQGSKAQNTEAAGEPTDSLLASIPTPTAEPVAIKRTDRQKPAQGPQSGEHQDAHRAPVKNVSVVAFPKPVPAVSRPETANLSDAASSPISPATKDTAQKPAEPYPAQNEDAQPSAKSSQSSAQPVQSKPAPAGSSVKTAAASGRAPAPKPAGREKTLTGVEGKDTPNPFAGFDVLGAVERAHAAEEAAAQGAQASVNEAEKPARNGASKNASALSKGKKNRKKRH